MTNKYGVSNHSNLYEVSRKNLVGKTKAQSPARWNKRLNYRARVAGRIDASRLIRDDYLVIKVPVGDYLCTVAFKGLMNTLIDVVSSQPTPNVTLQSVIRAVYRAIDKTDILVDCTCPDFYYRFGYVATKFGYKFGTPENRPAKITNPDDNKGAMCKHLTSILSNKSWLVKLSTEINNIIKKYYDDFLDNYKLDPEEFFINLPGRPSLKTLRNRKMANKKNKFNKEQEPEESDSEEINKEDSEELELNSEETNQED